MGQNLLETDFAGLKLRNPLVLLSGTAGYGREIKEIINLSKIGALICKTITLLPRKGNPPPRTAETPSGLVNSIGLENQGLVHFLEEDFPLIKRLPLPVLVSITGGAKELVWMAQKIEEKGALALELNLSCPNIGGEFSPVSQKEIFKLVNKVRKSVGLPILVKLAPDLFRISALVRAAEEGGASGLTIANTFPAVVFDVKRKRPLLGNITGGLSGPAILPLSLYLVYQARQVTKLPILGSGGVFDGDSALSMLLAGANAIGLGTVNFFQPDAYQEIIKRLIEYRRSSSSVMEKKSV